MSNGDVLKENADDADAVVNVEEEQVQRSSGDGSGDDDDGQADVVVVATTTSTTTTPPPSKSSSTTTAATTTLKSNVVKSDDGVDNKDDDNGDDEMVKVLSSAEGVIPSFSLPTGIVRFMKQDDETWTTDSEYFDAVVACEQCRQKTHRLQKSLSSILFNPSHSKVFASPDTSTVMKNGKQMINSLKKLQNQLDTKRLFKLQKMNRRPIIEKFLDDMNASEDERKVFYYVLVAACGLLNNTASAESGYEYNVRRMDRGTSVSINTVIDVFAPHNYDDTDIDSNDGNNGGIVTDTTANDDDDDEQVSGAAAAADNTGITAAVDGKGTTAAAAKDELIINNKKKTKKSDNKTGGGITLQTLLSMASVQSKWVKEQIYDRATKPTFHLSTMSETTLLAFMGSVELTLSQYQEIESPTLQKSLQRDELFQLTSAGKAVCKQQQQAAGSGTATPKSDDSKPRRRGAGPLANALTQLGDEKVDRIFKALSIAPGMMGNGGAGGSGMSMMMPSNKAKEKEEAEGETTTATLPKTLADAVDDDGKKLSTLTQGEEEKKEASSDEQEGSDTVLAISKSDESADAKDDDGNDDDDDDDEFGPYKCDLNYLEDQIKLMDREVNLTQLKHQVEKYDGGDLDGNNNMYNGGQMPIMYDAMGMPMSKDDMKLQQGNQIEKLEIKIQKLRTRIETKLNANADTTTPSSKNGTTTTTTTTTFFMPRLEQLCEALELHKFEKYVVLSLLKSIIMPGRNNGRQMYMGVGCTIGACIESFSSSLQEKMNCRKYFYKSSALIKEGILTISQQNFMTDLTNCKIELDRRMFDFIVGLDTEFSEIIDGSHLYEPNVNLDDVVLPDDTKKRICDCVLNLDKVKSAISKYEIEKKITYGTGQVLLFYGSSGTGKTMLANAVATRLRKKVLLVNFPSLGTNESGELIKFLFREARINKALLFFDECESLFMTRDKSAMGSVNMILTELERFDDLCILATNRPCDLDEAMYRRITLAVEFRKPDHIMREKIWKTLKPPKLPIDDDGIDFNELARKYELTGGLIKNSWMAALGLMVQRGNDKVMQEDLNQAASEQVISRLSLEEFESRVVPTRGIDALVLSPEVKESLNNIVQYTKAQTVLFGAWGFDKLHRATTGVSALFCGKPGTGKTIAAEAVGFDLGKPLKVVNIAQIVSKWVGETGKNLEGIFEDAKKKDAVLVFDEAEGLFGTRGGGETSVGRHDTMNVGLLLQLIENFVGICIVITNQKHAIDDAFFRRFRFVLDFEAPDTKQREKLWKSILPKECPLSADVNLTVLAQRYDLCGGNIKSAIFRAATRAALRGSEEDRVVRMIDLEEACDEEMKKGGDKTSQASMYV